MTNQTEQVLNCFLDEGTLQVYSEEYMSSDGSVDNRGFFEELCKKYKDNPRHGMAVGEASPLTCGIHSEKRAVSTR